MGRRIIISAVLLVVGGGIGFAACWYTRPAPATSAEPPPAGDEVVVEVRVKLPAGAVRPNEFHHSTSSLHQNALLNTGEPFDLAVEGQGFFQVVLPSGETVYTRDGAFGQNSTGHLVTKQGYLITPEIAIPQDAIDVSVGKDGCVCVRKAAETTVSVLGQIRLVRFNNPGWLRRDESGWWVETAESGPPHVGVPGADTFGLIRQGFRERQAALDAHTLIDLVREIIREDGGVRVRTGR